MRKNVLITGIQGFVGSELAIDQLARGNRVIGIVRDLNHKTRKDILSNCAIARGDIRDQSLVDDVMTKYDIDTVFHLAANSIVQHGVKDPVNNYDVNVMGTVKVLDSVRRINPKAKVVVASSDKAYGDHDVMPYVEDMKLNPGCPYSTSKACTDMISQSFSKTYGLDINTVRCSNIYGPGDMNVSRLIPNSILRCLNGRTPMIYSGVAEYRREFIYIDDVCNAYNLVAAKGVSGEIYNIGINSFHTISQVVTLIADLTGVREVEVVDKDFPEIPFQWMDGTKLQRLGWSPTIEFEEGLRRSVQWYTKRDAQDKEIKLWAKEKK